jgi:hypothetical protein
MHMLMREAMDNGSRVLDNMFVHGEHHVHPE